MYCARASLSKASSTFDRSPRPRAPARRPKGSAVLVGPSLDEHQFVAEVAEELDGLFEFAVVEEVGDDDGHAALRELCDELARAIHEVRRAFGLERGEKIEHGLEAMATAGGGERIVQFIAEGLHASWHRGGRGRRSRGLRRVGGRSQTCRVFMDALMSKRMRTGHAARAGTSLGRAFRDAKSAPIDGAQIVPFVELTMVEEFLTRSAEAGRVVAADEAGERLAPMDGEPFQALEQRGADQRFRHGRRPRSRWGSDSRESIRWFGRQRGRQNSG